MFSGVVDRNTRWCLAVLNLQLILFSSLVLGREERKKNKCVSGKVSKKVVVG